MGMLSEFKEFALRGNVVDMAIGVVIGGAFGNIVTSLVNDIFMPIISKITGGCVNSRLQVNKAKEPGRCRNWTGWTRTPLW